MTVVAAGGNNMEAKARSPASGPVSVIPACPKGLSFVKEDFLQPDFSIDTFLAKCTANASLERIRDDLGVYLKVLRSSMIELINQDYADFVNLSTNLVGLDKRIDSQLKEPLASYQQQIMKVENTFQSVYDQLQEKLRLKSELHQKRILLQNFEHISLNLNKIEKLLGCEDGGSGGGGVSGDVIERVAVEIHHLNYCMTKCPEESAFYKATRPRLDRLCDRLHAAMESQLLEAILEGNKTNLKRFLRVYSTVDRVHDAEALVRKRVVAPYIEDVVTEKSLASDPQGLKGVFQRCMKIVSGTLSPLLDLNSSSTSSHVVRDFNFLTRSLFPEIAEKFEENLSHCFSAGNPEKFHLNYRYSMDFLDDFESNLNYVETLENFRSCEHYTSFLNRWNLAVYYQIRFQEIALPVEVAMEDILEPSKADKFKLVSTECAYNALKKCWDPNIFLPVLAPKFSKLSFQIMSRFSNAISKTINDFAAEGVKASNSLLKSSVSSAAISQLQVPPNKGHARSASADQNFLGQQQMASMSSDSKRQKLILLHLDILTFTILVKEDLLNDVFGQLEGGAISEEGLRPAFEEACKTLEGNLVQLDNAIVEEITKLCLPSLKQVGDIPRLFRRTNREIPSKPLPYVTAVLQPIRTFYDETVEQCGEDKSRSWSASIVSVVADKYLGDVREVLEAVLKMEESLKRLKRARDVKKAGGGGGADTGQQQSTPADSAAALRTTSDDDKIRLQLYVDVCHLVQGLDFIAGGDGDSESPKPLRELQSAVTNAAQSCIDLVPSPLSEE